MSGTASSSIHLDARRSPALEINPDLLAAGGHTRQEPWQGGPAVRPTPRDYDDALRWMMVSDRLVSDEAARALLEVKERRLHVKEGHARWTTYLRAFVPLTARWCQQEMKRLRALNDLPQVAAAWEGGLIDKSHLRVLLRVANPATQETWLRSAAACTVRELEDLAARAKTGTAAHVDGDDDTAARLSRRVVMSPPDVAVLVSEAVEVARKLAGYQIGIGACIEMMTMETLAGLNESFPKPENATSLEPADCDGTGASSAGPAEAGDDDGGRPREDSGPLGDHPDLRRELGADWSRLHKCVEEASGRWRGLPAGLKEVLVEGAPPADAPAHERVVFWTGLQGRLDAVRGRLLRVVAERWLAHTLGFAGFGQYVRERMGARRITGS